MTSSETESSDPRIHARNLRAELHELVEHLRRDVERVEDPRAQALFETTAEVALGLEKAFSDFEEGTETAWRD
jgi:hypothetical protein